MVASSISQEAHTGIPNDRIKGLSGARRLDYELEHGLTSKLSDAREPSGTSYIFSRILWSRVHRRPRTSSVSEP